MLGTVILFGPFRSDEVPDFLWGMKPLLAGERNLLFTFVSREHSKQEGDPIRMVPGIGKVRAKTIQKFLKEEGLKPGQFLCPVCLSPELAYRLGLPATIMRARNKIIEGGDK